MLTSFSCCRLAPSTHEVYGCWWLWAHIFSALLSERKELSPRCSWENPREGLLPSHEPVTIARWCGDILISPAWVWLPAPRKSLWLVYSMISSSTWSLEWEVMIDNFLKRGERSATLGVEGDGHSESTPCLVWALASISPVPILSCCKSNLLKMFLFWSSYPLVQQFSNISHLGVTCRERVADAWLLP